MKIIDHALGEIPRHHFSILPTPLHKLGKISNLFGANIYCKRDDLTGFAFGGNKTRKLDYLISDAKGKKADTLIAVGAVQSNFCRITAAAGKAEGLGVHLVLGGKRSAAPSGNWMLDQMFGAEIDFVDSGDWSVWEEEAAGLADRLSRGGKNVYTMPVGGSTPVGSLGYVSAFGEILDQCERSGIRLDTIIHSSSSGGTQAGLIAGKAVSGWGGRIIGIGAAKNKFSLSAEISELASRTAAALGAVARREDVIVDDSFLGEGYGHKTQESLHAIKLFAEHEGIVLDHVYTAKAAAGLLEYARSGMFSENENILFIHTGGSPEIFS